MIFLQKIVSYTIATYFAKCDIKWLLKRGNSKLPLLFVHKIIRHPRCYISTALSSIKLMRKYISREIIVLLHNHVRISFELQVFETVKSLKFLFRNIKIFPNRCLDDYDMILL